MEKKKKPNSPCPSDMHIDISMVAIVAHGWSWGAKI
jgi:hypothetical protein